MADAQPQEKKQKKEKSLAQKIAETAKAEKPNNKEKAQLWELRRSKASLKKLRLMGYDDGQIISFLAKNGVNIDQEALEKIIGKAK